MRTFSGLVIAFSRRQLGLILGWTVALGPSVLDLRAQSTVALHGMVSSGHPLATQAGLEVLQLGGNAIDAAIAVGLSLGVVDGHNSGIGGGCFMMIHLPSGQFVLIDGRERAPAAAHRDMYLRDGKADTQLSQTGALASGIPGEIAAFDYAATHFGSLPFADHLRRAAELAEKGFPLSPIYATRLKAASDDLARFEASRAIFFPEGKLLEEGERLRQPDLAASYRAIAEHGSDWFYRGPFASRTEAWMKAHGGIITAQDFAEYTIELREPIRVAYRGREIINFPPPSSGGVHIAQMLQILERFNLSNTDEVTRLHLTAEAMKLAFADRAYWLGDPAFSQVPRGLVSPAYAEQLAGRIDWQRATAVTSHGEPPGAEQDFFGEPASDDRHTTHFSVADDEGYWVSCTATINTGFGAKVVIPGTGVLLNNEMDDFAAQPNVANYFGLIGAEANAIAPGKRPLSSMSPTIVLQSGRPVIALGAAGGPRIISCVLQEIISMIDLDYSPPAAVAAPRLHHQWFPPQLMYEPNLPQAVVDGLKARGHAMQLLTSSSTSHIVARSRDGSGFVGAADPRGDGLAAGW
jgi:gamma-glutamyltranspeptidase/glutathione hydrolase